jgi:GntR family transcriptional regulator
VEPSGAQTPSRATPGGRIKAVLARTKQNSSRRAYTLIRADIRTGRVAPDALLSEENLVQTLTMSRGAVREALHMLANEGLIERRPRAGTRVRREILQIKTDVVQSLTSAVGSDRIDLIRLDERLIVAPPLIVEMLQLPPNDEVLLIEWLITLDREPFAVRTAYISGGGKNAPPGDKAADIKAAFHKVFGVPLGTSTTTIAANAADVELAERLGIAEGAPVIVTELHQTDVNGTPRGMAFTHYRADRVCFSTSVSD